MLIQIKAAAREADPNAEPLQVEFYGEVFTCERDINQFALMEMAGAEADGEMAIMSAFYRFLQSIFIPDDWDRFRKMANTHRLGLEQLQPLIEGIAEAMVARPTEQPSALPAGLPPTGPKSRVVSLSPGSAPLTA